ncbi:MAG: hypothetical protein IT173_07555 [Acidobacteria bacterium]|nr:hypothetical protein [Acidobacteriota bacterium]
MLGTKLELFKNLAEWEFDGVSYDFHNEYECLSLKYESGNLILGFRELARPSNRLRIVCENAELTRIDLPLEERKEAFTLDTFYRGRYEEGARLVEADKLDRVYFFLEFYEGPSFEFWAKHIRLKFRSQDSEVS